MYLYIYICIYIYKYVYSYNIHAGVSHSASESDPAISSAPPSPLGASPNLCPTSFQLLSNRTPTCIHRSSLPPDFHFKVGSRLLACFEWLHINPLGVGSTCFERVETIGSLIAFVPDVTGHTKKGRTFVGPHFEGRSGTVAQQKRPLAPHFVNKK